jgi:hypothetical protein
MAEGSRAIAERERGRDVNKRKKGNCCLTRTTQERTKERARERERKGDDRCGATKGVA